MSHVVSHHDIRYSQALYEPHVSQSVKQLVLASVTASQVVLLISNSRIEWYSNKTCFRFLMSLLLLTVILLSVQSLLWPHRHPPHLLLFPHCAWPFIHPAPVASLFPEPEPEPGPGAYVHQPCLDACACTCTCAPHLSASPACP